jgi:hypothetical protein
MKNNRTNEHQPLTMRIKHLAVSALLFSKVRIKSSCNLTGHSFEMPKFTNTQPLPAILKTQKYDLQSLFN